MEWAHDDFTIVLVAQWTGQDIETFLLKAELTDPYSGINFYANVPTVGHVRSYLTAGQDLVTDGDGFSDGHPHVVVTRRAGFTAEIRVDGQPAVKNTFADIADVSAPGADMLIGTGIRGAAFGFQLTGQVSEIIAIHGELSDANLAALESRLMARYLVLPP